MRKLFFCLVTAAAASSPLFAQTNGLSYQGRLTDNGSPATGLYSFQLSLHRQMESSGPDDQVGLTATLAAVSVTNGMFALNVDFGADVFNGEERWLEIQVRAAGATNDYVVLRPRQRVAPIPYAIYASLAGSLTPGSIQPAMLGSNVIANVNLQDQTITQDKIRTNQVVKSLNGLRDDISISAGTNLAIVRAGNNLEISGLGGRAVNSLAELLGLNPAEAGGNVFVRGYYFAGDGGSGEFYFDPSSQAAPDGGTIFQSPGAQGRWIRLHPPGQAALDWFGARGDGVSDDFVPIQQAFDFLKMNGGGRLDLGRKVYRLTQELVVTNQNTLVIAGQGPGLTELVTDHAGARDIGFNFRTTTNSQGIAFENLTIRGGSDSDETPYDLILFGDYYSNSRLENVEFRYARHSALRWKGPNVGTNFVVNHCVFRQVNSSNMAELAGGVVLGFVNGVTVENCLFENNGNNPFQHAVYLSGVTNGLVQGNIFRGQNARVQIYNGVNRGLTIAHNVFEGVADVSFYDTDVITITGNVFNNSSVRLSCDHALFTGNVLQLTNLATAITIDPSGVGISLIGNLISSRISQAILVNNLQPVYIGGNSIIAYQGIVLAAGKNHIIENNLIQTVFGDGPLNALGDVDGVVSRNNFYRNSGFNTVMLKNEASGTNCLSINDTFEVSSGLPFFLNFTVLGRTMRSAGTTVAVDLGSAPVGVGVAGWPHSPLQVNGALATAVALRTNDCLLNERDSVIFADTTAAPFVVTLPRATGVAGREYRVKCIGSAHSVTVSATAPDLIRDEGTVSSPQLLFTAPTSRTFLSDGTNWWTL